MPPGQRQQVGTTGLPTPEVELPTTREPQNHPVRSPTALSDFFNGANSATVSGGNFVGVGRVENRHTQFTFNMLPSGLMAGTPADHRETNVVQNRRRDSIAFRASQRRLSFPTVARVVGALVRLGRRRPQQRGPQPANGNFERDSFQIYKRHMIIKGFGDPLWIPQCNIQLPIPYRRIGVRIGDVGIITQEGAFDCLFNICLSPEDPSGINSLVPDGFVPLNPPLDQRHHIIKLPAFSWNAYLASTDVHIEQSHPNGIDFVTAAQEGAILTMPRGAYVQRLANNNHFDEYIASHASSWYRLANGPLKRGIKNGDLCIVLGCYKSAAWGMATFASRPSSEAQRLRFSVNLDNYRPFSWELTGVGSVTTKVGPEPGDNDGLFDNQPQELLNQCLFIQTQAVSLTEDAWSTICQETTANTESRPETSAQPKLASRGQSSKVWKYSKCHSKFQKSREQGTAEFRHIKQF
ncbi:hypothetical protein CPB84DRAFT_993802 [Gymnopilus junonius]|uniref:Uncharacterized protein n=1 Tax=Gymnopilus junonius TaxID=109634 RepID=A0A9P5NNK2_GYMJU|nr:hypothetical protein CPB84DRAFT_993802 [Gymnopilus junonius]